jgi:hypothetical protein
MLFDDNTIIGRISKGKSPTELIETPYGVFEVKYPSGKDINVIARKKAASLGGMPTVSFGYETVLKIERDVTLSEVIITYPEGFAKEFKNENFEDFPDEEVKNSIFKAFNTFFIETQEAISRECRTKN